MERILKSNEHVEAADYSKSGAGEHIRMGLTDIGQTAGAFPVTIYRTEPEPMTFEESANCEPISVSKEVVDDDLTWLAKNVQVPNNYIQRSLGGHTTAASTDLMGPETIYTYDEWKKRREELQQTADEIIYATDSKADVDRAVKHLAGLDKVREPEECIAPKGFQLVSEAAIKYLHDEWPSAYPKFYELVDKSEAELLAEERRILIVDIHNVILDEYEEANGPIDNKNLAARLADWHLSRLTPK